MPSKLLSVFLDQAQRLNLVSKGDLEHVEEKHFPDSLKVLEYADFAPKNHVLDLGTGGGLPGLVLAEARPDCHFILMDARQKKIDAVMSMAREVGLTNVEGVAGRFEELAHDSEFREQFDLITARAVAPLPVLLEYAAGFLKVKGSLWAWKGPQYREEVHEAQRAMELLQLELTEERPYTLPSGETRVLLRFEKRGKTPRTYPREDGRPKKSPL